MSQWKGVAQLFDGSLDRPHRFLEERPEMLGEASFRQELAEPLVAYVSAPR
jgi:hypothetical protein